MLLFKSHMCEPAGYCVPSQTLEMGWDTATLASICTLIFWTGGACVLSQHLMTLTLQDKWHH